MVSRKLRRNTIINLNSLEILQFLILSYLYNWRIPPSIAIVEMSAPKNVTRFHYQDTIYLPRPQSLAIVLVVFKLNYQVKRDTGRNGKGRKKRGNVLPSHLSLRTLKKPTHEAVQIIPGMRCYWSYFHPTLFEEVIVYDFYWFLASYNNILKCFYAVNKM